MAPIRWALITYFTFESERILPLQNPVYHKLSFIDLPALLIVTLFGMVAGARLWGTHSGALRTVRAFIVARLGIKSADLLTLWLVFYRPAGIDFGIRAGVLILLEIFYFAIGWLYFKKSKRVANTFTQSGG